MTAHPGRRQGGSTMMEVLVTIVILAFGLLGLVGLQSRLQVSELEAYQRAQALILLNDMASRISTNRGAAASYVTANPVGAHMTCPSDTSTRQAADTRQWCEALQGAAEMIGESRVGVMVGGRGCVQSLGGGEYLVTVAWQGMAPLSAPPAGVSCGQGLYNGTGESPCANDRCRRAVTTVVRIATLT